MRQHPTRMHPDSDHWSVGWTGEKILPDRDSRVLVQLQESGNQARIILTPEEAEAMATELLRYARKARVANSPEEGA